MYTDAEHSWVGGGGGTPYNGLYGEAPPEGGIFQASGILKDRDFTS